MTEHYAWILKHNLAGQRIPEWIVECDKTVQWNNLTLLLIHETTLLKVNV